MKSVFVSCVSLLLPSCLLQENPAFEEGESDSATLITSASDSSEQPTSGEATETGGESTGGSADQDGDGLPDNEDPVPDDGQWPGLAEPDVVYASTSTALYTLNPLTNTLSSPLNFIPPISASEVAIEDIAINEQGVVYAISATTLYLANPNTGNLREVGFVPAPQPDSAAFHGLAWLPAPIMEMESPGLVAMTRDTNLVRIGLHQDAILFTGFLGNFASTSTSAPTQADDLFSDENGRTFAVFSQGALKNDELFKINPKTAKSVESVVSFKGKSGNVTGLAYLAQPSSQLYAFSNTGEVQRVNLSAEKPEPEVLLAANPVTPWTGASARAVLVAPPG